VHDRLQLTSRPSCGGVALSIMSRTPTSSLVGSLLPRDDLSPSNESRFVPRPSVLKDESVLERHFTASDGEEAEGKVIIQEEVANQAAPEVPMTLVADAEKDGIVGATICFTPQSSPRSSPTKLGGVQQLEAPDLDSLNSKSNEYIGSINGAGSGDTGTGVAAMSSSAMHIESSLDGRSTTEYEILDDISKGSIEVEDLSSEYEEEKESAEARTDKKEEETIEEEHNQGDLILEGEEDGEKREKKEAKTEEELEGMGLIATFPSLSVREGDDDSLTGRSPLEMPTTKDPVSAEEPLVSLSATDPLELNLSSLINKLDMNCSDNDSSNKENNDAESSTKSFPSPKVDERPLTPFKNLHNFWEGQGSFTHMTKSALGRILRNENPKADLSAGIPEDNAATTMKGTTDSENLANVKSSEIDVIAKTNMFIIPFATVKDALSGLAVSMSESLVAAILLFGMFLYGSLVTLKTVAESVLHRKIVIEADDETSSKEDIMLATSTGDPHKNADSSGALVKELVINDAPTLLLDEPAQKKSGSHANVNATALGSQEKTLLNRINDLVSDSVSSKHIRMMPALKIIRVLGAVVLCALITISQHSYILSGVQKESTPVEQDLRCFVSETTSFVSIEPWEFNLPSSFESLPSEAIFGEEGFQEEGPEEEILGETDSEEGGHSGSTSPRSLLSIFVVSSIFTSLFCAAIFKSKIPFPSSKSQKVENNITGIWSEEEHEQFIEGYNEYGSHWKLVSECVPTRTPTQVKSHGSYWLKIRSPVKMTKTRNTPVKAKQTPEALTSVSYSTSTPRKSNKGRPTPLKGILCESQMYQNVTPRSEGRTRRMTQMRAAKAQSDPGKKKARIRAHGG